MKQKWQQNKTSSGLILLLFLLVAFVNSCYEPIPGCSDTLAANYSFSRDRDCLECCTYPTVQFTWQHKYGADTFLIGKSFSTNATDSFRVLDSKIFITDIKLRSASGEDISFLKSTEYRRIDQSTFKLLDDFFLLKKTVATSTVGQARFIGFANHVTFSHTLNDSVKQIHTPFLPTTSPLADGEGMKAPDGSFYSAFFQVSKGSNPGDTLRIFATSNYIHDLQIQDAIEVVPGKSIQIPLTIDYQKLFAGISFRNDSLNIVQNKISQNIPEAFLPR